MPQRAPEDALADPISTPRSFRLFSLILFSGVRNPVAATSAKSLEVALPLVPRVCFFGDGDVSFDGIWRYKSVLERFSESTCFCYRPGFEPCSPCLTRDGLRGQRGIIDRVHRRPSSPPRTATRKLQNSPAAVPEVRVCIGIIYWACHLQLIA
jgi:hypothetical protein